MAVAVTSGVAALQRRGLSEVRVQKVMTAIGGCTEALFLLLLTAARSPWQFVSAWCGVIVGHCCHDHGFESNKSTSVRCANSAPAPSYSSYGPGLNQLLMDVWQGGPDAAIIESVMNPIANVPGLVGPLLATFFLRRFGSRMPLFALAALCQASAAAVFCRWASDRPARDIVTAQQQRAARRDE